MGEARGLNVGNFEELVTKVLSAKNILAFCRYLVSKNILNE